MLVDFKTASLKISIKCQRSKRSCDGIFMMWLKLYCHNDRFSFQNNRKMSFVVLAWTNQKVPNGRNIITSPSSNFYFGHLTILCHSSLPLDIFKRFSTRQEFLFHLEFSCATTAIFSSRFSYVTFSYPRNLPTNREMLFVLE